MVSTNLFILFFPFAKWTISSWLRRIKYKTAWCAYRVAIPNCSARNEVLNWILWQHLLLFWCQVSDKSICPRLSNLSSDCITSSLWYGFWFNLFNFWLQMRGVLFLLLGAIQLLFFYQSQLCWICQWHLVPLLPWHSSWICS